MAKALSKSPTYYKIREKSTGLYSTGGYSPSFKTLGKIWPLGFLKTHLRQLQKNNDLHIYKDCELVLFTENKDPSNITLRDLVDPLEQELVVERLKGK
jgi:hypothetical protein